MPSFPPEFEDDVDDVHVRRPPSDFAHIQVGTEFLDDLIGTSEDDLILGGEDGDSLSGWSGDDQLDGENGDDNVAGHAGNDELYGGAGDDLLTGGSGVDYFEGGTGNDDYWLGKDFGETVYDVEGFDRIVSSVSRSLADWTDVGIEGLIIASLARGRIATGTGGDDYLGFIQTGGVMDAGAGNDTLHGSDRGSDILIGGLGTDHMTGGTDTNDVPWYASDLDRFDFVDVADSTVGAGRDVIAEFSSRDDTIHLGRIDADTSIAGNQAFHFIEGEFTGAAGELRVYALDPADPTPELTTRIVAGDVDGDGVADFEIELVNAAPIFEANFIL